MIWLVLVAIACVAALILLSPFLIKRTEGVSRQEQGIAVYKQQLVELEADIARGVINASEADPVRLEIQRRILKVGGKGEYTASVSVARQPKLALILLIFVIGSTFGLYKYLGSPDLPSQPLAGRDIKKEKQDFAGGDMQSLVERLAEKLQEQPENLDGWVLLARTLSRMKRFEDAAKTYMRATTLAPNDVDLLVGAGENFYYSAQGTMSDDALKVFTKAADLDPKHPGARYYLAEYAAQKGDMEVALESWIALYRESEATAPFMNILHGRIKRAAQKTGRDVSVILSEKQVGEIAADGPSRAQRQAAAEMSASDRQDMIKTMVARLADRMESEPEFDGLMKLGKAYDVQGQLEKSAQSYGRAAELKQSDPLPLIMQALALVKNADASGAPPADAITVYRKVLALDENVAEAHWYVGLAEVAAGRKDVAMTHWQKMKTLVSEGTPLYANVTRAIKALSQPVQN